MRSSRQIVRENASMSLEQGYGALKSPSVETARSGYDLLNSPLLNKGTAFTDEERDAFDLHGLLPPMVSTLDEQAARRLQAMRQLPNDFERYVFLRGLQDSNEGFCQGSRHRPWPKPPRLGIGPSLTEGWTRMRCLECGSQAVTERPERTAQGYRRFRCRACGKQFNE